MTVLASIDRPTWYLDPTKFQDRKYHNWSDQELKSVYTLNSKGVPVDRIIATLRLDVNKTQVFNMVRVMKNRILSKCHLCGKTLNKVELTQNRKFKICSPCKVTQENRKIERRKSLLELGRCGCCGEAKVLKGHTYCKKCISSTYRTRIIKGLCGICGERKISKNSHALCEPCMETNRYNSRSMRLKRLGRKCK